MMTPIFALMLAAVFLAWRGNGSAAVICVLGVLALSIGQFLYEIYSPEYGFRMPWLQVNVPSLRSVG
jgi:hypothetical protein